MFNNKNHEEVLELSTDHINLLPSLHVCPTRYLSSPNEVEETKI